MKTRSPVTTSKYGADSCQEKLSQEIINIRKHIEWLISYSESMAVMAKYEDDSCQERLNQEIIDIRQHIKWLISYSEDRAAMAKSMFSCSFELKDVEPRGPELPRPDWLRVWMDGEDELEDQDEQDDDDIY